MIPRIAVAGVALAACAAACAPEGKSPPQVNNWADLADLCAKTDCEQFPVGYRTERVGSEDYYFSIPANGKDTAPAPGLYIERDEQGFIKRAVRLDPRNRHLSLGGGCCPGVWDRPGLQRPQRLGYTSPGEINFYEAQRPTSIVTGGRRSLVAFTSVEDLEGLGLPSFDKNFWLVWEGEVLEDIGLGGRRRELLLISKTPMLFGRHVWVECKTLCDIETVTFPADPQPGYPSATIANVRDPNYQPRACGDPKRADACLIGPEPFAVLPETLRWIEQIFERLKEKPQSH